MTLTITIDEKTLRVPRGISVLDAAKENGIFIPTLCSHPMVKASGSCRICVVEIDGMQGTPTACTTPVAEGMHVRTDTPALALLRKNILKLILSEHPYTCLVCAEKGDCFDLQSTVRKAGITTGCNTCPKNGFCELQTLADRLGLESMEFPIAYRGFPVESGDPLFDRDYNLCILCGRCVRMCEDVRRAGTLDFFFRGGRFRVGTAFGRSHEASECRFCGACVDVCPTGALFDKKAKWEGRPDSVVGSRCPLCNVGCPILVGRKGEKIIRIQGVHLPGAAHQGQICAKGRYGLAAGQAAPGRLSRPFLKRDGRWKETGWQEAIVWSAERLGKNRGRIAVAVSPHVACEDFDILEKFARAAGAKIYNTSLLARPAVARHFKKTPHSGKGSESYPQIPKSRVIVVWGSDPSVSHPILALDILEARQKGAFLVVVDPRRTTLARQADLHVPVSPGQDLPLVKELVRRIRPKKTNAGHADSCGTTTIVRTTGLSSEIIDQMVEILEHSPATVFLAGSGTALQEKSRELLEGMERLVSGVPKATLVPAWGEINLDKTLVRANRARSGRASDMADLLDAVSSGKVNALYAVGDLPQSPVWGSLDVLVVQSVWISEWMESAHALLPAAHILESGGRVKFSSSGEGSVRPVAGFWKQSKPDRWITSRIAGQMGLEGFSVKRSFPDHKSADEIRTEAVISGFLDSEPSQNLGSPQKGVRSLKTKDAGGRPGASFLMMAGTYPDSFRGGRISKWSAGLARPGRGDGLEIHPEDARSLGIRDGDPLVVRFGYGEEVSRKALVVSRVPEGAVYMHLDEGQGETWMFTRSFPCPVKIRKGSP